MPTTKRLWHKIFALVITALLILTILPQKSTFATTGISNDILEDPNNQPQREQGRVKRVKSTLDELILEVNIDDLSMQARAVNGLSFKQLSLPFSGTTEAVGKPELPTFGQFFAVPNGAQMQVEVLKADSKTIEDVLVYPAQEPLPDCYIAEEGRQESFPFAYDTDFYAQEGTYPEQVVSVDPVTSIRGVHASIARFFPVQYNPGLKQLTVYSYIKVRITFSGGTRSMGDLSKRAEAFENMYGNLLINYDTLEQVDFEAVRDENRGGGGVQFLIITHPNFESAANLLDAHRESQGITTAVVTTTTTGSTAAEIQAYIQNAYDTWLTPPEYVLLLGDAEYIPTNYVTTHPYDSELIGTDLYYATVDGTDYDADILMGRISVDTLTQATNHINRIINYPASGSHYNKIAMAAYFQDYDNYDGYEDRMFVLTSELIRNYMLTQSYDVQRIYYADSNVTPTHWNNTYYSSGGAIPAELLRANGFAWDGDAADITSAVNAGVLIMQHRDHGWRPGWGDPSYDYTNVNALTNGDKQPVVLSMNCQTGWFDNETDYSADTTASTSIFSEAWERNANGGAVGIVAGTRVTYSGYNDYMTMGMYDAIWPDFLTYNNTSFDRPEYRMSAVLNYGKLAMRSLWSGYASTNLIETEMFHWFGDPTMYLGQFQPAPKNKAFLPLVMKGTGSVSGFNGDFELGHVSWTESSSSGNDLITNSMPVTPHSGTWLAKFGENNLETDQLSQVVTIPPGQTDLHYWYWISSEDVCGYDYFRVKINGSAYQSYDLCSTYNTSGWVEEVLDLSAYAGTTVTLLFEVTTDSSLQSYLYLDDVSFQASGFNGDFELGHVSWTESSSSGNDLITNSMPVTPNSGTWLAKFGENHNETDQLWQDISIPAANPYLHYWYWINSSDVCGYDYFRVKINGSTYQSYDLCSSSITGGWVEEVFDLSAYAGTTVTLLFEVTTDGSLASYLYLDDVSFQAPAVGFNSQFTSEADGWEQHVGDWYLSGGWIYTYGMEAMVSSISYAENYSDFDYEVMMWRYGGAPYANRIIIRGTPNPIDSNGNWYNEYIFQYTRDGAYSVFKYVEGVAELIQTWTSSSAINTGDAWNTLRVVANGSSFYFYINGTLVWSGTDTSLTYGRVGIGMYWDTDYPGVDPDSLFVEYATLTPLTSRSAPITDTVSPEQQALNDAANLNPVGDENQAPME